VFIGRTNPYLGRFGFDHHPVAKPGFRARAAANRRYGRIGGIAMSVKTYRRKRNFKITSEPRGKRGRKSGGSKPQFVIQKHDASRLHYDFRLELDGTLKSWAVPKGPSLDPRRKALAVQVEDHPIEYGDFEGVIPKGQYGGGTVLLWDRGTWQPLHDPAEGYARGKLHFVLHGRKLRGQWSLVRMSGKSGGGGKNWLLMKLNDKYARKTRDVLTNAPRSVKSKRTLQVIASERADTPIAGVNLTHPDKLMFGPERFTKRDLAEYYESVKRWMLPHVVDRPLALRRCPDGVEGQCFIQRNWNKTLPSTVGKVDVGKGKKHEEHVAVHDLSGVISLVQIGVLEVHTWNCRSENIERPDQLVFDLDPGPGLPWRRVIEGARMLHRALESLKLPAFLKTSGGKGLHLTIPIVPNIDWDSAKSFCRTIAHSLAEKSDVFVVNMRKDLREGKIYLDYNRNDRSATAVAPYSTRARPGAAVSMPISWNELGKVKSADQFRLPAVRGYLAERKKDPWADFERSRIDLRKVPQAKFEA
jgi:bifunctional non-homologous end joining protein LigD